MRRITLLLALAVATFCLSCTSAETSSVKREPLIQTLKLNEPEETVPAVVVTPTPEPVEEMKAELKVEPDVIHTARLHAYVDPEPEEEYEEEILDSDYGPEVQTGEYHEDVPAADSGTYLGDWTITFYCPCEVCNGGYHGTASGAPLTPWHTCACTALPFGTRVYIEGVGEFVVEDTGVSGNWIDCCVDSHQQALDLGMRTAAVYIVG